MKLFTLILFFILAAAAFAAPRNGEELVAAMHAKYLGKWYKTMTFVQKTTNFKPDGTSEVATWYEAMTLPGKLRIDFAPMGSGNGILFADGKLFSMQNGKAASSRPFVHPLMVLGFDVYHQLAETTVSQLKGMGIDLSIIHEDKWQGKGAYVVGARKGDLKTPQFWIDKKNLYFVRLIQSGGRDNKTVRETLFNKYQKVKGGGWVSPEVEFFTDGKRTTLEEYTDVQAGIALDSSLWDPEKWLSADPSYFKLK